MRYGAPLLPPLAVMAALLARDIWLLPARAVRVVSLVGASLSLVWTGGYDAAYASQFSRPDARAVAMAWLQSHASPGTPVGVESAPTGLINLPYFVEAAGYRACILRFHPALLRQGENYLVLDNYSLEEHPRIPARQVERFLQALASDPHYTRVDRVHYVPSFLGLAFPIDGSPHDWRYADRVITIYRNVSPAARSVTGCSAVGGASVAALYRPGGQG
jgi:hypothetical protein